MCTGRSAHASALLFVFTATLDPEYLDPGKLRAAWSMWNWDAALVDQLMDGFVKAKALV